VKFDKPLALIIASLVLAGGFIFASAAFGLVARSETHISSVVFSHLVLGVSLGMVALVVTSLIDYKVWRAWAPYLYVAAILATALVFVPGIGFEHGGGRRWIDLGFGTIQPSEALKIGTILFLSAVCATLKGESASWRGLAGFGAVVSVPTILLIAQPDIGTLGVVFISAFAVFLVAGARLPQIGTIILGGLMMLAVLIMLRPYMLDRVLTFLDPSANQHAEGYQVKQSLIAIGSGGLWGRGFGQGVQKFTYLPEPMGDSIFAVAAEETGFFGASSLIIGFLLLALRGFTVAARAPDMFGALLAVGISVYFVSEAFINIASMLSLAPLTGIPLTFISQGGTAMLVSLGSAGILLNISQKNFKK
jgi:cell division protein FtsW